MGKHEETASAWDLTDEGLTLIMYGAVASEMLHAGKELGVFAHLSDHPGSTSRELADAVALDEYPLDILLTGLRGLRLVLGDDSGLRNHPLVEERYVQGKDALHLPFIHDIVNPGIGDFVESLRTSTNAGLRHFPGQGDSLYQRLRSDPGKQRQLHDHIHAISDSAMAGLIKTGALDGCRHLLDVAGGIGRNAITIAKHYPDLKITVVDLPPVVEAAAKNIADHGLTEQISTVACDVFNEPLPTGADSAFLTHVMPLWPAQTNVEILRKVHAVLPQGGNLLLFDAMQNDTRDGPLGTVLFPAYFLSVATGRGNFHPPTAYADWMAEAGFDQVKRFEGLPVDHCLHVGVK
ncbi:methyltransferase [Streptomyces sp. NPDC048297]|uniref:methyltransferase n=1 Tax=Streptomyces sp. NPDC048297 TaxID=3365531 RepID=UPI00370FD94A